MSLSIDVDTAIETVETERMNKNPLDLRNEPTLQIPYFTQFSPQQLSPSEGHHSFNLAQLLPSSSVANRTQTPSVGDPSKSINSSKQAEFLIGNLSSDHGPKDEGRGTMTRETGQIHHVSYPHPLLEEDYQRTLEVFKRLRKENRKLGMERTRIQKNCEVLRKEMDNRFSALAEKVEELRSANESLLETHADLARQLHEKRRIMSAQHQGARTRSSVSKVKPKAQSSELGFEIRDDGTIGSFTPFKKKQASRDPSVVATRSSSRKVSSSSTEEENDISMDEAIPYKKRTRRTRSNDSTANRSEKEPKSSFDDILEERARSHNLDINSIEFDTIRGLLSVQQSVAADVAQTPSNPRRTRSRRQPATTDSNGSSQTVTRKRKR